MVLRKELIMIIVAAGDDNIVPRKGSASVLLQFGQMVRLWGVSICFTSLASGCCDGCKQQLRQWGQCIDRLP